MKKRILVFMLLIVLSLPNIIYGEERGDVLVVPVKGDINEATAEFIDKAVNYAERNNLKGIIFEIDTYGGLVSSAEKVKNTILKTDIPTVSYVNNKAESAGVLLAISSRYLIMNDNATIGSAEPIPNNEKNLSFWRSVLRDTAQVRGKDPLIIEAMADKDIVINNITDRDKLVNLTSSESIDYGLANGRANNYDDILAFLDFENASVEIYEPDFKTSFVNIISNNLVSTILIMIGMTGFIIELFSPGFGVPGAVSVVAFATFFLGNILAGNSDWSALILFVLGLLLILFEIFIPGFGVIGIGGIISVILGLVLAMESIEIAALTISSSLVVTGVVGAWLIKRGYNSKFIDRVILNKSSSYDDGYISVDSVIYEVGDLGIAVTDLRPSGYVSFNGDKLDVLSVEGYIEKSSVVEIEKIEGHRVFVRRK